MYKHLHSHKISKLLALSLTFSLCSVCAAEEIPSLQTESARPISAYETAVEEIPTHYSTNFDTKSFQQKTVEFKGSPLAFRASEGSLYTAYPVAINTEKINLYIPEAYFHKRSINGFTAKTAPIFMPLTVTYAQEDKIAADEANTLILQALEHGYVVAVPNTLCLQPAENERLGKAPLYLLQAKAAIRYLRRNHHRLPAGNLDRITVSGKGIAGALALQLAASCNQEDYHSYLRGLSAAEGSDHVFAAQAYDPEISSVQDVHTYNWLLPDGRPDPYAVSRYIPLVNLKDILDRSMTSPNIDTAIAGIIASEETIVETLDGTLAESDDDTSTSENAGTNHNASTASATSAKAPKIIYDTKEYRDFLAKKAAYQKAQEEYRQFSIEHLPLSQNAEYLRMCVSSDNDTLKESSQDIKTAFEETGTKTEIPPLPTSSEQDANSLFAWIDDASAQQDVIDHKIAKLRKKEQDKLSRAKLLMDRASTKARKKQTSIERQAARNDGSVPYATITLNK